ncbi:MAG: hypothetical protein NTY83_03025 [Candidatus Micrarchaeota archaeon]|nr:hypothetical protein [Candidatus Micrarchaeota archaeon]
MADNESGARRPPPPPPTAAQKRATPPPPPAARRNTPPSPLVAQPAESASGPLPLVETKKNFREITGEEFFAHFKKALNIIRRSCGLPMQEFATSGGTLLFRRQEIAEFRNGSMEIPLESLGPEVGIYGRIFSNIKSGEIAAPSFAGHSSIPHGIFLSISSSGVELRFRAMLHAVCKLLAKMGKVDPALSAAISVQGDSVLFKSGAETMEIATIPESGGEVRLYLKDISWGTVPCKVLLGECGASVSEDKLAFIFMHTHVYFRIREDGFALCASNKRESEPLIYLIFQIE